MSRTDLVEKYPSGIALRDDLNLTFTENGVIFKSQKKQIRLTNLKPEDVLFIRLLKKGISTNEFPSVLTTKSHLFLLKMFEEHEAIRSSVKDFETEFTSLKQLDWISHFLPDLTKYKQILETKVAIIGCGGIGSIVADHFVRSGFKKLVLIDSAKLDLPDLNRQWPYHRKNVGQAKIEALKENLLQLNETVQIQAYNVHISDHENLYQLLCKKEVDFIFCCADTPRLSINGWTAEAALKLDVPVMFGGVGIDSVAIGPLLDNSSLKRKYANAMYAAAKNNNENGVVSGSICFTNSLAAVEIGFAAFQFLLNIGTPEAYHNTLYKNALNLKLIEKINWNNYG